MIIRQANENDIPVLAELFEDSVRQIAPEQYSPAQVAAWAASAANVESFGRFILESTTFIVETDDLMLGFGGVTKPGYLSSLYVRGGYNRQGVGSRLLTQILEYARTDNISRLYTKASEFSKPLFEKFAFKIYDEVDIERNDVVFHRYLMQRFL